MKKCFFLALISVLIIASPFSHAFGDNNYFKGTLGIVNQGDSDVILDGYSYGNMSFDGGMSFAGAYGFYRENGRAEIELVLQNNDADYFTDTSGMLGSGPVNGELSATQILGNYYTDFQSDGAVVPYVGGGAGLFLIKFDDGTDTLESTNLGYHLDLGIGINTSDNMMFDIGLRYTSTLSRPSDNFGGVEFEWDYTNTTITFSFRMDM